MVTRAIWLSPVADATWEGHLPISAMKNDSQSKRFNRRKFTTLLAGTAAATPALLGQEPTPPAGARTAPPPQNRPTPGAPNPNTNQQRRATMQEVPPFAEALSFNRSDMKTKEEPFAI